LKRSNRRPDKTVNNGYKNGGNKKEKHGKSYDPEDFSEDFPGNRHIS
jgi:hypothetical protein